MKFKSSLALAAILAFSFACKDSYIDDIEPVSPGADESAPSISINYPSEGTRIRVVEDVTSLDISFEVEDDIEIGTINVSLDGTSIGTYDSFVDYRRAVITLPYTTLGNGDHELIVSATDLSGKSSSSSVNFQKAEPYQPQYEGEIFYLPFDGEYLELVTLTDGTVVGNPSFSSDRVQGTNSYAGATDSYVTFPTEGFLGEEFSASFWYKINASPDRSGILTIGPADTTNPTAQNNRTSGFRLFREGSATRQVIKLNVGNGTADSWFDGGDAAAIDPTANDGWIHLAFTISNSEAVVYINGEIAKQGAFTGVDWTGCDILSVASGAPRFSGWNHLSDLSLYDELRIFNKALTQEEIQTIIENENP